MEPQAVRIWTTVSLFSSLLRRPGRLGPALLPGMAVLRQMKVMLMGAAGAAAAP